MKIIKLIISGKYVQLGFEGKILYLKWGKVPNPMKLGKLKDIKALGSQRTIEHNNQTTKTPSILIAMAKGITIDGLLLAKSYTDEEFYNDFLKDFKDQHKEGILKFIGESKKWD